MNLDRPELLESMLARAAAELEAESQRQRADQLATTGVTIETALRDRLMHQAQELQSWRDKEARMRQEAETQVQLQAQTQAALDTAQAALMEERAACRRARLELADLRHRHLMTASGRSVMADSGERCLILVLDLRPVETGDLVGHLWQRTNAVVLEGLSAGVRSPACVSTLDAARQCLLTGIDALSLACTLLGYDLFWYERVCTGERESSASRSKGGHCAWSPLDDTVSDVHSGDLASVTSSAVELPVMVDLINHMHDGLQTLRLKTFLIADNSFDVGSLPKGGQLVLMTGDEPTIELAELFAKAPLDFA